MKNVKFVTQWSRFEDSGLFVHSISEEDCAIPDLSYTVAELRRKFTLQTEILMSQQKNPSRFMFAAMDRDQLDELNDEQLSEMFDAPPAALPRNYDLVDMGNDREAYRRAMVQLRNMHSSARVRTSSSVQEPASASSSEAGSAPSE